MIDFAAEFGLDYVLIDAGWYGDHRDGDADITRRSPVWTSPASARTARTKNVRVQVWLNWETCARRWRWRSRCTRSGASRA